MAFVSKRTHILENDPRYVAISEKKNLEERTFLQLLLERSCLGSYPPAKPPLSILHHRHFPVTSQKKAVTNRRRKENRYEVGIGHGCSDDSDVETGTPLIRRAWNGEGVGQWPRQVKLSSFRNTI